MNTSLAPRLRTSFLNWLEPDVAPTSPWWVQWAWTGACATLVAAGISALTLVMASRGAGWPSGSTWAGAFGPSFVVSLVIAVAIQSLFVLGRRLVGSARIGAFGRLRRCAYYGAVSLAGLLVGLPLGLRLLGHGLPVAAPADIARSLLVGLVAWGLLALHFSAKHKQVLAERRAAQAQLERLQAQIEPHFLFNTLANVLGLIDTDAARAKRMLESFSDYLRVSFLDLRGTPRTLGDELDLVAAYLCVVGLRMEGRLQCEVQVAERLRALPMPALCLQPLVENAVIHGLEPSIEGGRITLSAELDGGQLRLRVIDDGVGLEAARRAPRRGCGSAVANIRERLRQLYGDAAGLELRAMRPHGTCATLSLPVAVTARRDPCPPH